MKPEYLLGIDCGTQSTKVVLFDRKGNVIHSAREPVPLDRHRPNWAEQRAEDWWLSLCVALRSLTNQVDPTCIIGLSVANQRETFVPVDSEFTPLRPAILWMDQRAVSQSAEVRRVISDTRFRKLTGKPLNATPSIMKIKWIKENEPETWRKTRRILTVGAYINYHLTGEIIDSTAGADTTGLFDIESNDWSDELLGLVDLERDWLFRVVPATSQIGSIENSVAIQTGLSVGTPVFAGGGDGQVFAVGAGAIHQSEMAVILGTSGICGVHGTTLNPETNYRAMTACIDGSYFYEAVIMSAANTVSWFVRNFDCPDADPQGQPDDEPPEARLERQISSIPPCSNGLLTIPYLRGCMMPYQDPRARGATLGWSDTHTRAHLYRSILEGIAFEIKLIIGDYETANGVAIDSVRIGGGGAESPVWSQIIADVTGVDILVPTTTENTALGAAVIAAVGCGMYSSVETSTQNMCNVRDIYAPDSQAASTYSRFFHQIYKEVYPAIRKYLNSLCDYDPSAS